MTRSGTKGCAERCDSSVPNHRDAITTAQNTGRASSFASAPDVPSASEAPSVTKLPVTCAVKRPCNARKPAVSTKPALKLSSRGNSGRGEHAGMIPSIEAVKMMDRAMALADTKAVGGSDRRRDPRLGVAHGDLKRFALRETCGNRR